MRYVKDYIFISVGKRFLIEVYGGGMKNNFLGPCAGQDLSDVKPSNIDGFVKGRKFNYGWLSKKVHIQGVQILQS
jgi:hypothetical protein